MSLRSSTDTPLRRSAVGLRDWGCGPVDESTLEALILDGPNDLAPLISSPVQSTSDVIR
jgi:hypothetical protein